MASSAGRLIVIEGLEGAGKSTAIKVVEDILNQASIKTIKTREPGGTAIGEILRSIIKDTEHTATLDQKSELLMLYAARMQLIKEVIRPALEQGSWVIADRFELSTLAYQGGGSDLDADFIKSLSNYCLQGFKPDLTLYLDINPELGMQRAKSRGACDRIELQAMDFFHKVHQTYLYHAQIDPSILTIDASLSEAEVQKEIEKILLSYLEHTHELN